MWWVRTGPNEVHDVIKYTSSLSPKASLKRICSLHSNMACQTQSWWSTRPVTNNTVIGRPVNIVTLIRKLHYINIHGHACNLQYMV